MMLVTTTMGHRYHVLGNCWCKPEVYDCPEHGREVAHHDILTGREDVMPRMTVFSTGGCGSGDWADR
jgi:hypothetical protein